MCQFCSTKNVISKSALTEKNSRLMHDSVLLSHIVPYLCPDEILKP